MQKYTGQSVEGGDLNTWTPSVLMVSELSFYLPVHHCCQSAHDRGDHRKHPPSCRRPSSFDWSGKWRSHDISLVVQEAPATTAL